jgi:tetratricopeptide (TPR) repeat protein
MTATASFAQSGTRDYNKEIAESTQALSRNPNDAEAYFNRGYAYFKKKDYDRAIADYKKVSELDRNSRQGILARFKLMGLDPPAEGVKTTETHTLGKPDEVF